MEPGFLDRTVFACLAGHQQTGLGEPQHGFHLGTASPWKPLLKVVNGSSVLKVLEEGTDGNPSPLKYPSTANPHGVSLDSIALAPI